MSLEVIVSDLAKDKQVAVKSSFKEFLEKANEYSKIIDGIEIKDVDDKENLTNARQARLFLKNQRGDMKRLTESERNKIKAEKLQWDLLDKAWLKSYQFVEEVYKGLESKAEEKEKFVERLEEERKEKVRAERWEQLSKYMDFEPEGLKIMTDEVFSHVLKGAKADYQERIEAEKKAEEERLEAERIDKLHQERRDSLLPYWNFVPDAFKALNMGMATDMEFRSVMEEAKKAQKDHEAEQAKIKAENERLKKEREAEQARLAKEAEERRIKEEKEVAARKAKEEAEAKQRAIEEAKRKAEFDRIQKQLEDERKKRLEEETRKAKEEEAKKKLEEEAKKAPDKKKIQNAIQELSLPVLELNPDSKPTYDEILDKFSKFKVWANNKVKEL